MVVLGAVVITVRVFDITREMAMCARALVRALCSPTKAQLGMLRAVQVLNVHWCTSAA
jgi:hypothetical protein